MDSRDTEWLLRSEFDEQRPAISPNGRWIAYDSNESGQREVYVRPFPSVNQGEWLISTDGGFGPVWSHDGKELFYLARGSMTRVEVRLEAGFSYGTPAVLFDATRYISGTGTHRMYDEAPDGSFIMVASGFNGLSASAESERTGVVLIQNWSEELSRLVPAN